jgi:hypothetical protein
MTKTEKRKLIALLKRIQKKCDKYDYSWTWLQVHIEQLSKQVTESK